MKKVMITLLAGASVLSLVACTPKRYERQSKPKTASSSSVKKEKKDTGQKHYQEVLDRYKSYAVAIHTKDKTALQNELKQLQKNMRMSLTFKHLGVPMSGNMLLRILIVMVMMNC